MSDNSARVAPSALAGILVLVTAVACFAVLDTTVKYVGATVSVEVFFRREGDIGLRIARDPADAGERHGEAAG